jgi:hypothetical protein
VGARFERAVERCAAGTLARFFEGVDLGVRLAGALVRAITNHDAFVGHNARADDGVRRGAPEAAACVFERPPHPSSVYHFS